MLGEAGADEEGHCFSAGVDPLHGHSSSIPAHERDSAVWVFLLELIHSFMDSVTH